MDSEKIMKNHLVKTGTLQAPSSPDSTSTLERAQAFSDRGWYNEAIELFSQIVDGAPADPVALLEYGNTLFKKGDLKGAGALFEKIVSLRPDRIDGWNNLGIVQTRLGDVAAAHESFSHVLSIEPDNTGALLNKGNCFFSDGRYHEALACFTRACTVRADLADGWYNLGNTYIALGRLNDARMALEKALRLSRDFPSAQKNLGWIHEKEGRMDEAERCYTEALSSQKSDSRLYVNLGNVYVKQKRYDDAKKSFLKAIRLAPNDLNGWMGLRGYALAKGDIGTFVRSTMAVLGRLSDEVLAQSIEVLYELQQTDKADMVLAQAERLGKKGPLLEVQRLLLYQRQGIDREVIKPVLDRLCAMENPDDAVCRGLARYFLTEQSYKDVVRYIGLIRYPDGIAAGLRWRAMVGLGNLADARREIREYVRLNGEGFDTFFLLADIEARKNNRKRAETLLVYALDFGFCNMKEIHVNPVLHELFESMAGKKSADDAENSI